MDGAGHDSSVPGPPTEVLVSSIQVLDEDDPEIPIVTATVTITGNSDDIGRALDVLSDVASAHVQLEIPGWVRVFYGWELNVWQAK